MLGDLRMAIRRLKSAIWLCLLVQRAVALQVTPSSPCAALCIDDPTGNVSDPGASTTQGSDIVCSDSSYTTKPVGQKFKSCLSCLQNSSTIAMGESDQAWFIYNMRFAIDSCLFDFHNATEAISTPCSTDSTCGHLSQALLNGDLDPATESTWGYCSADGNAFLGRYHDICLQCLENGTEQYLANFMTALKAGCLQRPVDGWIIGIEGSVFSSTPVNITYTQMGISSNTSSSKHGLSERAIIGISVGLGVLLIITMATLYACWRKGRGAKRMEKLRSPLDSRFGAINISAPTDGAYGDPYANPPITVNQQFRHEDLSVKERHALGMDIPIALQRPPTRAQKSSNQEAKEQTAVGQSPSHSPRSMPAHKAYVPSPSLPSRVTSISSDNNYQLSNYSSPRTSPRDPPALRVPYNENPTPPIQISPEPYGNFSRPRESPATPPGPPPIDTPDSDISRADSQNVGRKLTSRLGVGNSNASNSGPLKISNPMVTHSSRFDFEFAERERRQQEHIDRRRRIESTPESAHSDEQWPGSY